MVGESRSLGKVCDSVDFPELDSKVIYKVCLPGQVFPGIIKSQYVHSIKVHLV